MKTRILEDETPPLSQEPENSNQSDEPVESTQDDQEDLPEDVEDSQSTSDDDEPSVSTRPWTRSQGPPPALVGTKSLSKCSLNSPAPPSSTDVLGGYIGKVECNWTFSILEDCQLFWNKLHLSQCTV